MSQSSQDKFDFIVNEPLRASLTADHTELRTCFNGECWKAVHVLAGSIIEAVLIDHLLAINHQTSDPNHLYSLTLGPLIDLCVKEQIISKKAANLATVIKDYRNLIHPGRQFRTKDTPDKDSATISDTLVDIITKEIAEQRKLTVGYTADQILNKIQIDTSSIKFFGHLIADMSESEMEKLLLNSIPNRYFEIVDQMETVGPDFGAPDEETLGALSQAHRHVFQKSSDEIKRKVCKQFVVIVKEDSGEYVETYQDAFFRCPDMIYLVKKDQSLIRDQVINRVTNSIGSIEIQICVGLSMFLDKQNVAKFVDVLVRTALYNNNTLLKRKAMEYLKSEFYLNERDAFLKRIDDWINLHESRGTTEYIHLLNNIKTAYEIPF